MFFRIIYHVINQSPFFLFFNPFTFELQMDATSFQGEINPKSGLKFFASETLDTKCTKHSLFDGPLPYLYTHF